VHEVEAEIGVPVELMLLRGQASAWDSHKPTGLRLRGARRARDVAEIGDAGDKGREAEVGHLVAEGPGGAERAGPALVSRDRHTSPQVRSEPRRRGRAGRGGRRSGPAVRDEPAAQAHPPPGYQRHGALEAGLGFRRRRRGLRRDEARRRRQGLSAKRNVWGQSLSRW